MFNKISEGSRMFSAARVGKHLHVRVSFVPFVALSATAGVGLILCAWGILWLGFQRESYQLRQTLRQEIAGAMADGFEDVMLKHTVRTLDLSNCRSELQQTKAVNKDLARMVNTKAQVGGIGGTP
jgi:hypothetical protein